MIIISTQVHPTPWLSTVALSGHLAGLLLGFGAVLRVAVVGVLALGAKRAMSRLDPALPRSLMQRGMVLTAASQSFWWTAVVVGFLTHQSRH